MMAQPSSIPIRALLKIKDLNSRLPGLKLLSQVLGIVFLVTLLLLRIRFYLFSGMVIKLMQASQYQKQDCPLGIFMDGLLMEFISQMLIKQKAQMPLILDPTDLVILSIKTLMAIT